MRFRFGHILLSILAGATVASCVDYDMSYPRFRAEFTDFEVENAVTVDIDPSTMTVTVTLDETGDLSDVSVSTVALNEGSEFKSGTFPQSLDLSSGSYEVVLRNHHDYRWKIKAVQPVSRYVKCANQVGDAFFDVIEREAFVYVSKSQRLKSLSFSDVKFELIGSVVTSTSGVTYKDETLVTETLPCSFPYEQDGIVLDCTNRRVFNVQSRGETVEWGLTVIPVIVPAQIVSVAPWCWSADIKATFDGTSQPPVVLYRQSSDEEWITVPDENVTIDGINCNFHLSDLQQETSYEVRLVFEGEELPGASFMTDAPAQLPNFNFDNWWTPNDGGLWYPYAQDAQNPVWDSANAGTAGFGLGSSTVPEENDVHTPGGMAVKMTSKYVAVKFAAGNLFTGKFNRVIGTSGADLDWGVPFTSKPKSLKGWYKYQPALVNYEDNKSVAAPEEYDQGQLQVLLVEVEHPYRVLPVKVGEKTINGPTYKDQNVIIDLASDPTVIARGIVNVGMSDPDGDGNADWVEFELPLEYRDFRNPTYVVVTAASSYLGDYFTGGHGSVLLIDDFEFVYQ